MSAINLAIVPSNEAPTDERLAKFHEVQQAEEKAKAIIVNDDHSAEVALVFLNEIRGLHDLLEDMRDAEVRPLNTQVKKINDDYRPYTTLCKAIDTRLDRQVKDFRAEQRRLKEEAQRKAIAEAAAERARKEAEAAELRRQAEEAKRQEAEAAKAAQAQEALHASLADLEAQKEHAKANDDQDTLMVLEKREAVIQESLDTLPVSAVTETRESLQAALLAIQSWKAVARANGDEDELVVLEAKEKKLREQLAQLSTDLTVVDLEAQAQQAELEAATVAPEVVQQVQKTVALATGAKISFTTKKVPVCLPGGLPVDGVYYRDDARLKTLPDDLFVLDVKRLRNRVKDGQAIPGVEVREEEISRRGGR